MNAFLLAYGGGHVAMLAPVAAALRARGHQTTFLALTTARRHLEQLGEPCIGCRDLPGADAPEVLAYGTRLADELSGGPVSREESIAYLGLSFSELVADHGEARAWELYRREGRAAFLPVSTMRRYLEAFRPDVVVATNSPRMERAAIVAAGQLGIASVCAVDLFALQEVKWIGVQGYANRLCVLNAAVRDMFLGCGRGADEVVVTGNPAFDRLFTEEARIHGDRLREARGWRDGLMNVLWASQIEPAKHPFDDRFGDPDLPRRVEAALRGLVANDPRFRLVVRYHPSEVVQFLPAERVEESPRGENLQALLHAVDAVVVTASTVGLEASLVGLPVVSVDCSVFTADAPYSRMGISTGVAGPEAIPGALRDLADSTGLARREAASGAERTENATDRMAAVVESLGG